MKAVRFTAWKTFPSIEEVERPTPGPGEVLLKIAGAGACHSDVAIFEQFDESMGTQLAPSYTLGHENAGWVEELGEGVTGITQGEAYLVYGPIGCGACPACSRGQDTYCHNAATQPYLATGLGRDGGMAEYMTVPARNLVPLGDADPVDAAPLADAGLTPYHAIKLSLPKLAGGGKTALVIGLGGLGQIAVQILKALTGATVIATDVKPEAMAEAEANGAVTVPGGADQAERIRALTGGQGVDAVFDFVGITATIKVAQQVVRRQGRITVVGVAGGPTTWDFYSNPYEAELTNTYWGTIEELYEVAALYRAGQITPSVKRYPMDQALQAYHDLHDGKLSGRAVVMPNA
ncbi:MULTISPECIES: NAD(P)-dependent alcohol dehydrogenase [unclassified Leucobacter]|uniref:NAD(P)-dependent alcohol dehydrogenase n=1 Tax=unclassified Leucobacter TaxID=2621730 RepID=UPI00165EBA9C|nr:MULTISPECIES: NAD(P)-dependent alcohol dehydrogenase [unclassified Leucobacter]MBC9928691.1 NAD(P)-dependent alcohol dehydrogenase [Leucobacter sp. cx-169]